MRCLCDCGNEFIALSQCLVSGSTKSCGCLKSELSSERRRVDLVGQRFGKLTVIEEAYVKNYARYWRCKCDCGNETIVQTRKLKCGDTKSCGCYHKEKMFDVRGLDLTGQKFGMLTAIAPTDKRIHGRIAWDCICECGTKKLAQSTELLSGHVYSCGCCKSKGEAIVGKYLTENNINFTKEYWFDDLRTENGGALKFDFALLDDNDNLISLIEFQGIQHYQETSRNGFGDQQRLVTDDMKRKYCEEHNIVLHEIRYDDNVQEKLDQIIHANTVGSDDESQPVSTILGSEE